MGNLSTEAKKRQEQRKKARRIRLERYVRFRKLIRHTLKDLTQLFEGEDPRKPVHMTDWPII